MTRNQKAKTILNAIDKYAPTCIDWNLEAMWLDALARGLIDIEKEEFQKQNPERACHLWTICSGSTEAWKKC